jgi:hypothetical protein
VGYCTDYECTTSISRVITISDLSELTLAYSLKDKTINGSYRVPQVTDYPMLNSDACFINKDTTERFPIHTCLSPFHVELLSPVFEYNTIKALT